MSKYNEHRPLPHEPAFRGWLEDRDMQGSTVSNVISDCRRVQALSGKLPNNKDGIRPLVKKLSLPTEKVEASIRNGLRRYVEFIEQQQVAQN